MGEHVSAIREAISLTHKAVSVQRALERLQQGELVMGQSADPYIWFIGTLDLSQPWLTEQMTLEVLPDRKSGQPSNTGLRVCVPYLPDRKGITHVAFFDYIFDPQTNRWSIVQGDYNQAETKSNGTFKTFFDQDINEILIHAITQVYVQGFDTNTESSITEIYKRIFDSSDIVHNRAEWQSTIQHKPFTAQVLYALQVVRQVANQYRQQQQIAS